MIDYNCGFAKFFNISDEIEKLEKQVKIEFRAGKPTKKYKKLMQKLDDLTKLSRTSDFL